jgi:hypothetical protein
MDFLMRLKVFSFNGDLDINELLDYISKCDKLRKYVNIIEEEMVKLIIYKYKGEASSWWNVRHINM